MASRKRDESKLLADIMSQLCHPHTGIMGLVLWRNSTGYDPTNRVHYGLGNGGADIIGLYLGHFIGIECKTPTGRVSPEQRMWIQLVRKCGGRAGVARTVGDACRIVDGEIVD